MTANASRAHSTAVGSALTNRPIGPVVAVRRGGVVDVRWPGSVAGGCSLAERAPAAVAGWALDFGEVPARACPVAVCCRPAARRVEPAPVVDGREACDVPDAEPAVTDGALRADVSAPAALDVDGNTLGVETVCEATGGAFTGGVWIGGTVTVGVLMLGVLILGVLIVGVVIGPTVIDGTVTEGTVTDGTDTVGSRGRAVETVGSVSADAPALPRAAEFPRAAAVDNATPASRPAQATRTVSSRRDLPPIAARPMNERLDIAHRSSYSPGKPHT